MYPSIVVEAEVPDSTVEQAAQTCEIDNAIGLVPELPHVIEPAHLRLHQRPYAVRRFLNRRSPKYEPSRHRLPSAAGNVAA
jgi:hypothetical protein